MADIHLSQDEADALIALPKHRENGDAIGFYPVSGALSIPLFSSEKREHFFLDVRRRRIDIAKGTYQTRARKAVPLVRLDFGFNPHRNPDDELIPSPHLHRYREGYDLKWAVPLPTDQFSTTGDLWTLLFEFMSYCNVVEPPNFMKGVVS
jgi:hypothetical protein